MRMTRAGYAWAASLLLAVAARAGGEAAATNALPAAPASAGNATNGLWFPVGETLTYRLSWGLVPVGETVASSRWLEEEGQRLLEITIRTRSNKVLSSLYPVDDTIQVVIDPVSFLPVTLFMDLREGRHTKRELTSFDYARGVARWERLTKKTVQEIAIDTNVLDLVTFMYAMRRGRFEVGTNRHHRVLTDGKVYDLTLKTEAIETVDVADYGDVACARVDPSAQFNGLFVRKGKLTAWVTRDARAFCVRVEAGIPVVGTVKAVLASVVGPGSDRWVVKPQTPAPASPPVRIRR